jgi:hypothetical protein
MSKKRKVIIGSNPDAQLELHVEVDTGIIIDTKGGGDWNDAERLAEIYTSVTGKKARKKADAEDLFDLIFEHIEELQAGYMKMVDSGPVAESDEGEHDAEPNHEVIGRWTRTYKGATFALVQTSEGYTIEAPLAHPANGKTYDSPTAAAMDVTGYKSVSGRAWFSMDETATPKVNSGGEGAQCRYPPVQVEDPRLPVIGRVVKFQHKGVAYTLQRTTTGYYSAEPTDGSGPCYLVGEADGLHGLAAKISGHRVTPSQAFAFFNLDPKGDLHDPWLILGCLVRDGAIRAGDIEDSLNLLESEQATYAEVAQAANDLSRELYGRSILKNLGLDPAEVMAGKPS